MNESIKESQAQGELGPGPSGESEVGSLAGRMRRMAWASTGAQATQGGPGHKAVGWSQWETLFKVSFVWVWCFVLLCLANLNIRTFRILEQHVKMRY